MKFANLICNGRELESSLGKEAAVILQIQEFDARLSEQTFCIDYNG